MPKVTFKPLGKTVDAQIGQSILEIAESNGIHLNSACGGNAACSTCHVIFHQGFEDLTPSSEEEEDALDKADFLSEFSRLGCQARLTADREYVIEIPPADEIH